MKALNWLERRRLRWAAQMAMTESVAVYGQQLKFVCTTGTEVWRARSAASKEAGTVAWIGEAVQPGETFCDIGANIGLYTLMAGLRVGAGGAVYAFEPHAANFVSLMRNIVANRQEQIVRPFGCALHDAEGLFEFNYENLMAGTSMSQLGATKDGEEREFKPVVREAKLATSLDRLVGSGGLKAPHHVKIDVDGNELPILRGMQRLLHGAQRPRSLQVEINERYRDELMAFMDGCGYVLHHRHHTAAGLERIAQGADPALIPHNAVFQPRG